jgi:hypothetical protein
MSRDLGPTELRVCRMVFAFLAAMVFAFLVFNAIESLSKPSPPVRKTQVQPVITISTGGHPKQPSQSSPPMQTPGAQSQKELAGGVVADEPTRVSFAYMKVRLEQLGEMALQNAIRFDPQPLEQRLDAHSAAVPKPASTEVSQPQWTGKIIFASASTEPPSLKPPQEIKVPPERSAPTPQPESKEASPGAESFTYGNVLQIKSRLRDLGFLSSTKNDRWDPSARDALRDFKLVNHLANDDTLDFQTSEKLNSQTAIRADQSFIGSWSTAPCRSAKTPNIRLSISSRRVKSSAGSVCEFRDLQSNNREWRVRANCSQGNQRWTANGKFALMANKLVWTSEQDVISYFRCN